MQDTGCLVLVHWDDPEGWYGEGEHDYGERETVKDAFFHVGILAPAMDRVQDG